MTIEEPDPEITVTPVAEAVDELYRDTEPTLTAYALASEFWGTYPELAHVRDYAHHHGGFPEPLLAALLCRLSALVRRGTVVDSGMLNPLPLNMFAGLVGASGHGKSSAKGLARRLLPFDGDHWTGDPLADFVERGLGSGEGIAEAFMGAVPDPMSVGPKGGRPQKIRKQVRYNALLVADEGGYLAGTLHRDGSALGPLLREAWGEDRMGQQNAAAERTRDVRDHALGIIVAFQPRPAAVLFTDDQVELGMPQRWLWVPARTVWPDERPDDPGPLKWEPLGAGTVLRPPQQIRDQLYDAYRYGQSLAPLDGQRPAMLLKLSALLAALCQRAEVTETDWHLAEALYRLSRATGDAIREHALELADRDKERKRIERVADSLAVKNAVADQGVDGLRVLRRLIDRTATAEAKGLAVTRRELRDWINSRDRHHFKPALEYALKNDHLIHDSEAHGYRLGEADIP